MSQLLDTLKPFKNHGVLSTILPQLFIKMFSLFSAGDCQQINGGQSAVYYDTDFIKFNSMIGHIANPIILHFYTWKASCSLFYFALFWIKM